MVEAGEVVGSVLEFERLPLIEGGPDRMVDWSEIVDWCGETLEGGDLKHVRVTITLED